MLLPTCYSGYTYDPIAEQCIEDASPTASLESIVTSTLTPTPGGLTSAGGRVITATVVIQPMTLSVGGSILNSQLPSIPSISFSTSTSLVSSTTSSTSNTSSNQEAPASTGGLSSTAKMAIAIVCAVLCTALIALGGFLLYRRKQRLPRQTPINSTQEVYKAELDAESRAPVEMAAYRPNSYGGVNHVAGLHELSASRGVDR